MSWTDERVAILTRMWMEGASASQIAKELGSVTRNAVIGKVHRLGLNNRNAEPAAAKAPPAAADKVESDTVAETPVPPRPEETPAPEAPAMVEPAPAADSVAGDDVPEAVTEAEAAPAETGQVVPMPGRRPFAPAGQPLPPQPSANEVSPEALANVREVEKGARKLHLMDLTERTCKWPIGDPATEEFWFCGLPVKPGKPYCEAHVSVAFQPMQSRRDRRR